ncbi:MAG: hypothetical protein GC185_04620 [Alphaproteobacteria bacterium]|nr:hypothetical protein [Alphaproteobacteria bacterium]
MFASSSKDIDAKVVNNAMVVAFNTGDTPRVWRADMSHMKTATLEVRSDKPEKGKYQLVLKSADNDDVVETFADKEQAAAALRLMSEAMMKGDSALAAAAQPAAPGKGGFFRGVFKLVVAFVLVVVLYLGLKFVFISQVLAPRMGDPGQAGYPGIKNGPAPLKEGVPLPPDQLFGQ